MSLPFINSSSFSTNLRMGGLKQDINQNDKEIKTQFEIREPLKSDSQLSKLITENPSTSSIGSVFQPQYKKNAPVSKPKNVTQTFLGKNKNEIKKTEAEIANSKAIVKYFSKAEIVNEENSFEKVGKGFFVIDPKFKGNRKNSKNEISINEKLHDFFDNNRKMKPGRLVDLKF